jgi:hypothetical protein
MIFLKFIMTQRTALVSILLLSAGAVVHAGPKAPLTVAVYDFKSQNDAAGYGRKIAALVTSDLAAETNMVMLQRVELTSALNEQAFGISGLLSSDAAARIGQITGAKVLVSGELMVTEQNHLVVLANIIGMETGRLYAAKAEGGPDTLFEIASSLSSKITQIIAEQLTNLIAAPVESAGARMERIVKSVTGPHRPSVSVNILWTQGQGHCATAEVELGAILLKAGFPVVDGESERKAEVEIKGVADRSEGPGRGQLFSYRTVIQLKAENRRTGDFIAMDREESIATEATRMGAEQSALVQAADALAERVLPLLAK